jgi:hypothetical protein
MSDERRKLRDENLKRLDAAMRGIPDRRPPRDAAAEPAPRDAAAATTNPPGHGGYRGYGDLPINQSSRKATPDLPETPTPRSLGTPVNESSPTDEPQSQELGGPNPGTPPEAQKGIKR